MIRRFDRRGLGRLGMACAFGVISDVGALGLLLPFLTVAANPKLIDSHWLIAPVRAYLGIESGLKAFTVLCGVTILGFFGLAAGRIWSRYTTVRFIHRQRDRACQALLQGHFYTQYWGRVERSTRELLESVFGDVDVFVDKAVRPTVELLLNLLLCALFVAVLCYADALGAMLVISSAAVYFLGLFWLTRSSIDSSGRARACANTERFRHALNILDGRRDIRIYGVEGPFFEAFGGASRKFADSVTANQTLIQLSAYLTHAIAFSAIIAGITFATVRGGDISLAVPLIGTYIFAGARLIPALAGAFQAWSELRFANPAVEAIEATLSYVEVSPRSRADESVNDRMAFSERIVFEDVAFGYPRGRTVHCCSGLTIRSGKIIAVTGESGAGKSAFLLSLTGMLPLKAGAILIDGTELTLENRRSWLNNISYIGQSPFFLDDSVASNVAFGIPPELQDRDRIIQAAKGAGAHEFIINDIANGYDGSIGEGGLRLSCGQRQRVAIARALYANRQLLLLDEMTSALDRTSEKKVIETLHELRGKYTLVLVTHRPEPLEICDEVFSLQGECLEAAM
jgi:ATP-binding cassette, subfamily B, bacterial PglK